MSDLSRQASELLHAGKTGIEPAAGAAARVRAKLDASVAGAGANAGGELPQHAGGSAGAATSAVTAIRATVAIVGLSAGLALLYLAVDRRGGDPGSASSPKAPAAQASTARHDAGASPPADLTDEQPKAGEPPAGERDRDEPERPRAAEPPGATSPDSPARERSGGAAPPAEAPRDSLRAELRLIERARSQLARQRPARALDALARHEAEFPSGQLRQEGAELRVRALCAAGRDADAEAAAARLAARFPDSPFASRRDGACDR